MSDATIGFDQTEEEMLTYEVPDEALEAAAARGTKKRGTTRFIGT
jgi:hypothetical protein